MKTRKQAVNTFTLEQILSHHKQTEALENFLGKIGKEYAEISQQKVPESASFDSYDLDSLDAGFIYITYYETWRYGGEDYHTVQLPISVLEDTILEEAAAKMKEERLAAEKAAKERAEAQEKARRLAHYERLKAEFEGK